MQILRTVPNFYPYVTGPAKESLHVSQRLAQRGITSRIVTSNVQAQQAPSQETFEGVSVTRLKATVGVMAYRFYRGEAELRRGREDLIHAHSYRNRLTEIAARIARKRGAPFVLQPHASLYLYRALLPRPMHLPYIAYDIATRKRAVLQADAVVLATQQERQEAIAFGVAEERTHVIPFGADLGPARAQQSSVSPVNITYVGRIAPGRGVEQVLTAAAKVRAKRADFVVRIVGPAASNSMLQSGDRYMAKLQAMAERLGLRGMVTFVGPRYGDDLTQEYRQADVFVYPSVYENFGQTVLAAAAHGAAIIATPTGVARDLIRDNETGHLVQYGDTAALAERLAHLIEHPSTRLHLGAAAQNVVARDYSWNSVIDAYEALYRSLV